MKSKNCKFVVLSSQRSGSTWLLDMLHQGTSAAVFGELFLSEPRTWDVGSDRIRRYCMSAERRKGHRPMSVLSYLDRVFKSDTHVGFKLMYGQLCRFPAILYYLRMRRTKVVHLVRLNHLDVYISRSYSRRRNLYHRRQGRDGGGGAPITVEVDLTEFRWFLGRRIVERLTIDGLLRGLGLNVHVVEYEGLVTGKSQTMRSVCDFLEIGSASRWDSSLSRVRQESREGVIENWTEVKAALSGTKWEWMLSSPDVEGDSGRPSLMPSSDNG